MDLFLYIFTTLNFTLAIPLNLNLIVLRLTNKTVFKTENYLLISLSITDILGTIFTPAVLLVTNINFNSCLYLSQLSFMVVGLSCYTVLLMILEKFLATIKALEFPKIWTKRRVLIIIIVQWLTICFISFIPSLGWNRDMERSEKNVTFQCDIVNVFSTSYMYIWCGITIIPCTIVGFILYVPIIRAIRKQRKAISSISNNTIVESQGSSLRVLICLLANNSLLWIILLILTFLYFHNRDNNQFNRNSKLSIISKIFSAITLSHPSINPIIHGYIRKSIRSQTKNMLNQLFRSIKCKTS